eukprot:jgi/Bigna1/91229/estExt_fgenesh1_pg.C_930054
MAIEVNKRAGTQQEFQEYRDLIDTHASGLWEQGFRVYTEMGRSLTAKMGWTATRVEAVKESGGRRIAIGTRMVHERPMKDEYDFKISVFTHDGEPKDVAEEELLPQDVAGPLCFSGDMVAVARPLPRIEEGDIVVVHDTGAYTYSMYSRYNSRLAPAAYGNLCCRSLQVSQCRRGKDKFPNCEGCGNGGSGIAVLGKPFCIQMMAGVASIECRQHCKYQYSAKS